MSATREEDLLQIAADWKRAGRQVALATVTATWGSQPAPGRAASWWSTTEGSMLGSVSGGCIEGAVVREAIEIMADGKPRLLDFGVTNEQAWEVGLACGGKLQVFVERVE